jgi:hypothetical protein
MNSPRYIPEPDPAVCKAMRRFLDAADEAVTAVRAMEAAKAALDRAASREPLRLVGAEGEESHAPQS